MWITEISKNLISISCDIDDIFTPNTTHFNWKFHEKLGKIKILVSAVISKSPSQVVHLQNLHLQLANVDDNSDMYDVSLWVVQWTHFNDCIHTTCKNQNKIEMQSGDTEITVILSIFAMGETQLQ